MSTNGVNRGDRVAVVDASMKEFLGFGIYCGDHFRPGVTVQHVISAVMETFHDYETNPKVFPGNRPDPETMFRGLLNPMIFLDERRIVWGCETWWGPAVEFISNGYAAQCDIYAGDRWADDGGMCPAQGGER